MRKKTAGLVLAAAGAVLILSALLLLFHNRQEDRQAGERSQAVLEELRRVATDDATLPVGSLAGTEGFLIPLLIIRPWTTIQGAIRIPPPHLDVSIRLLAYFL